VVSIRDVETALASAAPPLPSSPAAPPPPDRRLSPPQRKRAARAAAQAATGEGSVEQTAMQVGDKAAAIRRAVARKMTESAAVPQFTVWRDLHLDAADAHRDGVSWTTVLLQAYARALRRVPRLLTRWDGERAVETGPPSVALAVDSEHGLMVPVFVEPDTANPRRLDEDLRATAAAARLGKVDAQHQAVANGSLSNLGGLGVDRFQALVTPPQASVLALGGIARRPVAVPGGLGTALVVTAGLTVDHRVADGADAARLLDLMAGDLA
jgi:pyruvate dehydrogenase E2 component (dihydrolipoamide acetyltransferase)